MNPQQALLQISTWIDNHRLPYYGLRDNYYQWSNTVNTVNIFISLDEFYKLNNHINNIFNIINMPPTTNVSRLLQIAKFNMEAKWANTHTQTHKHTHTNTHTHTLIWDIKIMICPEVDCHRTYALIHLALKIAEYLHT